MTPPKGSTEFKLLQQELKYIKDDVKEIKDELKANLVNQDQFLALKGRVLLLEKAVYGFIGLALIALLGAVFAGVLK